MRKAHKNETQLSVEHTDRNPCNGIELFIEFHWPRASELMGHRSQGDSNPAPLTVHNCPTS